MWCMSGDKGSHQASWLLFCHLSAVQTCGSSWLILYPLGSYRSKGASSPRSQLRSHWIPLGTS
jgi:hypothetical protein